MPTSVIDYIRRTVLLHDRAELCDSELLGQFVERRDEIALAALVNRHGPMVWGVCRRLLGHHDAEDAFQATFIVLVRKASSILPREMIGNWLYGVAHQTALQARRTASRRREKEVQMTEFPETKKVEQDCWSDLQLVLDQELSRLPDHYRVVIVLSDLEGKSRKEVAAELGCPEGTVASRLARARSMLARRLTQRGIVLSGGTLAAVLSQTAASAGVPVSVVSSTIKVANLIAAGQAVIPFKVAALAEGVMKTMLLTKLKSAMAILMVSAMIGLIGFDVVMGQQNQDEKPKARKVEGVVVNEKVPPIVWGKEIEGLQIGLGGSRVVGQGETIKFTVHVRNVGKADIRFTHGLLREYAPTVTAPDGIEMSVYMPLRLGIKVRLVERVIKPGETFALYTPELAVESEARAAMLGEMRVDTPTICVKPGKYKIAYGRMIQNRPKLTTGTMEFEVTDQVAWGKEIGGLQMGIAGVERTCRQGEKTRFTLKVRNVGKAEATFTYSALRDYAPSVTTDLGGRVSVYMPLPFDNYAVPISRTLKPGEMITLYNPELAVESEAVTRLQGLIRVDTPTICVEPGKYKIMYSRMIQSRPKLATGTMEFEVKDQVAWGREIGGLQAGLAVSQNRTYHTGEVLKIVLRVRNVGKESVDFKHIWAYFVENPPSITNPDGKAVTLPKAVAEGFHRPRNTRVEPGKEVDLHQWTFQLRSVKTIGIDDVASLYGVGKFSFRCEHVVGPTSANPTHPNLALDKLATGKLELIIQPAKR